MKQVDGKMVWEGDQELRAITLESLSSAENPTETLEALGTLILAGFEDDAKTWLKENNIGQDSFNKVCEDLADSMDDAEGDLSINIEKLYRAEGEGYDLQEQIINQLSVRDSVECVLVAAEMVGLKLENINLQVSVDAFEQIFQPILWKTLLLDQERRSARYVWVKFEYRGRFWWWRKGDEIGSAADAIKLLPVFADLLLQFPEIQQEIDELKKSCQIMHMSRQIT